MIDSEMDAILDAMKREVVRAMATFHHFHSMHEGYAVIAEELDEVWDGVKSNDAEQALREAIQVGAMAVRFILDIRRLASKDGRLPTAKSLSVGVSSRGE